MSIQAETVIAGFLKLRGKLDEERAKYNAIEKEYKGKMEKLEAWLLQNMQAVGTTQLKVAAGVAYTQEDVKASAADWPTVWECMSNTGRFDMLEKRISNKTVKDYFEQTGELPPGINIHRELKVVVRKS